MKYLTTLCTSLLVCSTQANYLTPATNLDIVKQQITHYHQSGAYAIAIAHAANRALVILQHAVQHHKKATHPLAMVLDIDETSLSNYPDLKHHDFSLPGITADLIAGKVREPAIAPTLKLYRYAQKHHITVFFVTGRPETMRTNTLKSLGTAGYQGVEGSTQPCETLPVVKQCTLYLRSGSYLHTSAIPYKTAMRKKITQAGYCIVVNIGDQFSDLAGGFSEYTIKYPNYMYYIA